MTTATTILRTEHDAILRMLDATEEVARQLDRGQRVAPETLTGLLEFFRLFADRCHHGKEEDLLFPLLEKKGLPRAGGPIGVMLHEHEQGRALVKQMADAAEAYGAGAAEAGGRWAEAARGYSFLLRQHIDKENNVLFVMAENLLSSTEQAELATAFEKVEEEKMGPGTHERLHALMDKLTAQILGR
ncbi:MAG TPA: hemerythrin domain-containing protein [Candidatus Acidoferrales bacterium]|nr:hemerythrin domain-containing protein [Candidatus Acidoferrales bacterium]